MRISDLPTDGEPNIKDSSLSLRPVNLIHPTHQNPSSPTPKPPPTLQIRDSTTRNFGIQYPYRRHPLDYVDEEADAQAARRGLWAGEFVKPWEWRRGKRIVANDNAPNQCRIKGNINVVLY